MTVTKRSVINKIAIIVGMLFYMTACDAPTQTEKENYDLFQDLETVEGAEQTKVTINQGSAVGRDAYFEFEIDNVNTNLIAPGVYDGWCIEWTKPIAQQGDIHEDLMMYSTYGKSKWKPLNYFLNIKNELKKNDPELTFREFQAVIWSITEGPEFNLNSLSDDELPARLLDNGTPNFSKDKVNNIVEQVRTHSSSFTYGPDTQYALFMKTGDDEQDIMVPADPPKDEVRIEIEDLDRGTLHSLTEAREINNHGQVAGFSNFPSNTGPNGIIYIWEESSGITDLGRHPDAAEPEDAFAYDINNDGQVAAVQFPYAVKWDPSTGIEALGEGEAFGMNDNGAVVGRSRIPGGGSHAILWDEHGNEIILKKLSDIHSSSAEPDDNSAQDINNLDQIAGYSSDPQTPDDSHRAVIWENGEIADELGTLGGNSSEALAINDQGQVVGRSQIAGSGDDRNRAFLWDATDGMINLGTIDDYASEATDINSHGQVVGNIIIPFESGQPSQTRGFYWDNERGMILLEPLEGGDFSQAYGINDDGEIVGLSSTDDIPETRAVKWTLYFEK